MSADPEAVERLENSHKRQTEKLVRALEDKQDTDEQHNIQARPDIKQVPPTAEPQVTSGPKVRKASVGDYAYGGSASSSSSPKKVRFQGPGEEGLGRAAFGSPGALGISSGPEERMEVDSPKGTKRALVEDE